jgi:hypothetical protein
MSHLQCCCLGFLMGLVLGALRVPLPLIALAWMAVVLMLDRPAKAAP